MLKSIELSGFKSFAKKTELHFPSKISAIVGPNGSGKSNAAEAFRFALGEQSMKSLRGKKSDDLLFNGSSAVPRANRAGVKVIFDNSNSRLDVDFDEVAIERIMHRDSSHQYFVNDSQVRLKDILEILAGANIGSTGHHIISQGEADRILRVKPAERKIIIEDALGLKIYHYKKRESKRKLEKVNDNLGEIKASLNEIAPRLSFLEREMNKIRKARELKEALAHTAQKYFASRTWYRNKDKETLLNEEKELKEELAECKEKVEVYRKALEKPVDVVEQKEELAAYEKELQEYDKKHKELERTLGRVEGQLELYEEAHEQIEDESVLSVHVKELRTLIDKILEMAHEFSAENLREHINNLFEEFVGKRSSSVAHKSKEEQKQKREELTEKKKALEESLQKLEEESKEKQKQIHALRETIEELTASSQDREGVLLDLKDHESDIENKLAHISYKKEDITQQEEEDKEEIVDAGLVFGRVVSRYADLLSSSDFAPIEKDSLKEIRRKIERGKVKVEEANLSSAKDIEREYEDVKDRSDFLQKEIDDLKNTKSSLASLITELERELNEKFKEGMHEINEEFDRFFSIMFGGGSASLSTVQEEKNDGEVEEGIEIEVQLPQKRVKGLTMLSGGERSLTSIALIFAISQINPPPFLILDETDAALDEANSRRYGDMIESLSEKSQLVLVTHNRETMARADLLYGVTMGKDGVSRVLSVKFEDAKEMAAR